MAGYVERRSLSYLHLEDPMFKTHFRMNKACFERLVNAIHHHRIVSGRMVRNRTNTGEKTLMGLWILFNKDTFRSSGSNQGRSMGVHHYHYREFIEILNEIGHRYIKWPNARQRQQTARHYQRNFGFPNVVGAIDGTLVPITAPREQKQRYVDRNHDYSINIQIVSDHKRQIRDIFIGQPGSVNDARVFRRSPLAHCLFTRDDMMRADEHLVGDQAYALTNKLLVPYRNNGHLNDSQRYFNYTLSQCRATVERLNGLLKLRMQRLGKLYTKEIHTACLHIGASAVIYNFILLGGEEMDGMQFGEDLLPVDVLRAINASKRLGRRKRENIRANIEALFAQYED
ncbi:hypothetical protein FOCC_FOCC006357 [Frankliniella occidentalis]|uniref:Uncharacterized protein LOC113212739 n=1 Tax=Frankliniella occidentalis TaxID=133901 RepID=A0A9C6WXW4_FRAOC|nr:uncharacterized protein LOC113212739 [Frankliniella occidentalis]XP_052123470.1 uncharacterized protein LOC113212739 [Frankliniella occidentalis]KAE8746937.1 hypothetical protein FOCC_FOCC006357 [Frankliniella occidentalis]